MATKKEKEKEEIKEPNFDINEDGELTLRPDEEPSKIIMVTDDVDVAITKLEKLKKRQDTDIAFADKIEGLPLSTFIALSRAITEMLGEFEALREGFWGSRPPSRLSVKTGPTTQVEVFHGILAPPGWKGGTITMVPNPTDFMSVQVGIEIKRRFEPAAKRLMARAKEIAKRNSFYFGQPWELDLDWLGLPASMRPDAVTTAPRLIEDLDKTPKLILPIDIQNRIDTHLWGPIRSPDDFRYNEMPIKNGFILLGPGGTGKTLTIMHTIQIAVESNFSVFKLLNPNWFVEAHKIAQFYAPSVLICEDVDKSQRFAGPRNDEMDETLDVLDGVRSKNKEVIVIATTNFPDKINEFVRRPGRLGTSIPFRNMDCDSAGRMVAEKGGKYLSMDMNLAQIGRELDDLSASDVDHALKYAKQIAIVRFGRDIKGKLTTGIVLDGIVLMKQDKGVYGKQEISQEASDLMLVRAGFAVQRGVQVPPEVWHVMSQYVKQREKAAKGRGVPDEETLVAETE